QGQISLPLSRRCSGTQPTLQQTITFNLRPVTTLLKSKSAGRQRASSARELASRSLWPSLEPASKTPAPLSTVLARPSLAVRQVALPLAYIARPAHRCANQVWAGIARTSRPTLRTTTDAATSALRGTLAKTALAWHPPTRLVIRAQAIRARRVKARRSARRTVGLRRAALEHAFRCCI